MSQRLAMNRRVVLYFLDEALRGLRERTGVQELASFGSVARDEAGRGGDDDMLVTFEGRTGFRDHLAHAYLGLDNDTVWEVVTTGLPA